MTDKLTWGAIEYARKHLVKMSRNILAPALSMPIAELKRREEKDSQAECSDYLCKKALQTMNLTMDIVQQRYAEHLRHEVLYHLKENPLTSKELQSLRLKLFKTSLGLLTDLLGCNKSALALTESNTSACPYLVAIKLFQTAAEKLGNPNLTREEIMAQVQPMEAFKPTSQKRCFTAEISAATEAVRE